MLVKAQDFLTALIVTLSLYPSIRHMLEACNKLINSYKTSQKLTFVNNFFKTSQPVKQNIDVFVSQFNNMILTIHINVKRSCFISTSPLSFSPDVSCINCSACIFVECDGSVQCESCGLIIRNQIAVAWSDISRVHAAPIYSYDKKVQFKECLLQYQGKCNAIDGDLLKRINMPYSYMSKLDFLHALKGITKQRTHIEQVHALYYIASNITPPDLTLNENNMLQDFDKFNKMYNKTTKASSSISNQFLLYQFLNKYGYKTSKDDVLMVDSVDSLPDKICQNIFLQLNWKVYT